MAMRRVMLACLVLCSVSRAAAQEGEPSLRCAPADSVPDDAGRHRQSCLVALEGIEAYHRGEYGVATRKFEESLWMSVTFEPGWKEYWLARSLLGIGKTREAAFAFYRALRAEERESQPDSVLLGSIRLWLGRSYDLLGRRGQAVRWYTEVVDSPAAPAHKEEAQRHLASPFRDDPAPASPTERRLRAVLRDAMVGQDTHRTSRGVYTDDPAALGVSDAEGVRLLIGLLDGGAGYIAEARSVKGAQVCRVAVGRGVRSRERGVIRCE